MKGWKSNLLSYGGRITLVKAVMSAMPLHFMQAFKVSKGVIRHIDQMRRNFLWKGNDPCKGINCLVNWSRVCGLKLNGGMGIIDLACQNDALLTKWLWAMQQQPNGIWATTIGRLYGISDAMQIDHLTIRSFFLNQLAQLLPFFACSVQYDQIEQRYTWRWSTTSIFTCASAYKKMHDSGARCAYRLVEAKNTHEGQNIPLVNVGQQDLDSGSPHRQRLSDPGGMSHVYRSSGRNTGSSHVELLLCDRVLEGSFRSFQHNLEGG